MARGCQQKRKDKHRGELNGLFAYWRVAGGPWYPFGILRLGLPLHSLCLGMDLASIAVLCDSSSWIARVVGVVVARKRICISSHSADPAPGPSVRFGSWGEAFGGPNNVKTI